MASRQLAAFHQPVVSHKPLPLYHCCRSAAAASVFALKSSPTNVGTEEPPLTAKIAALPLVDPDCHVTPMFVTALLVLLSAISTEYNRGLLPLTESTPRVLKLTRPLAMNAIGALPNQSSEMNDLLSVVPLACRM